MKPKLPLEIEMKLPEDIVRLIYSFVPHTTSTPSASPSLQRELERIQKLSLHGKKETYLRGLDDFVLE